MPNYIAHAPHSSLISHFSSPVPPIEPQADQNRRRAVHADVIESLHDLCDARTMLLLPACLCSDEYVVLARVPSVVLIAHGVLVTWYGSSFE